nr:uncharacterized protein LOC117226725 [Megalopta genalis]
MSPISDTFAAVHAILRLVERCSRFPPYREFICLRKARETCENLLCFLRFEGTNDLLHDIFGMFLSFCHKRFFTFSRSRTCFSFFLQAAKVSIVYSSSNADCFSFLVDKILRTVLTAKTFVRKPEPGRNSCKCIQCHVVNRSICKISAIHLRFAGSGSLKRTFATFITKVTNIYHRSLVHSVRVWPPVRTPNPSIYMCTRICMRTLVVTHIKLKKKKKENHIKTECLLMSERPCELCVYVCFLSYWNIQISLSLLVDYTRLTFVFLFHARDNEKCLFLIVLIVRTSHLHSSISSRTKKKKKERKSGETKFESCPTGNDLVEEQKKLERSIRRYTTCNIDDGSTLFKCPLPLEITRLRDFSF